MKRTWSFISTVLKVIFRHPVLGVTLIPVLPDGKIVLVKRRDSGKWSLPGGMVDWGNTVPETAKKELKEETGLHLVNFRDLAGVYSDYHRDPRLHSISVTLEVEAVGIIDVTDSSEISEAKAFLVDDLPRGDLAHDHDVQLSNYLQKIRTIA